MLEGCEDDHVAERIEDGIVIVRVVVRQADETCAVGIDHANLVDVTARAGEDNLPAVLVNRPRRGGGRGRARRQGEACASREDVCERGNGWHQPEEQAEGREEDQADREGSAPRGTKKARAALAGGVFAIEIGRWHGLHCYQISLPGRLFLPLLHFDRANKSSLHHLLIRRVCLLRNHRRPFRNDL